MEKTGLTLGDFDVLAQLANVGGELRMTELAMGTFSSRSGMTRRVDRLAGEGLGARFLIAVTLQQRRQNRVVATRANGRVQPSEAAASAPLGNGWQTRIASIRVPGC